MKYLSENAATYFYPEILRDSKNIRFICVGNPEYSKYHNLYAFVHVPCCMTSIGTVFLRQQCPSGRPAFFDLIKHESND